ncbi:DUF2183 domain-containing protein [Mycena sanguinolenta]|uniref:DUF2183 domain-containing protein n=1 Tax=Mycena sanguinolenta TaxID=230812 RepID=A0A8H6YBX9_9AGAR|nr:DUF2183 domain-containing protein [Mycena sanguinolenta]
MRLTLTFLTLVLASFESAYALPRAYQRPSRRSSVDVLDDVLVFDAPAFDDPANPENTLVQLQGYVATREISIQSLLSGISTLLNQTLGLDISQDLATATSRLALFGTIPLSGKTITANVNGCGNAVTLPPLTALSSTDSRNINFTMFPSSADGFGVISDIDDTVKVSHTLDKLQLAQATLIDTPVPVTGMPDVYASLSKSLESPQFIYVSASPFQLYPFLRDFIDTTYSASSGPIMLNNLTTTSLSSIIDFAQDNGIEAYKSAMIDRIQGMYPGKKFLTVGDSTQKDPETYGEAIRKYGDFIACAWIRKVDGANNTDERFAEAFAGVSPSKYKLYTDDEIPGLANIDVAGGSCS